VFLRICEDRGVEDYGRLKKVVEGKAFMRVFTNDFNGPKKKCNFGLFHFRKEADRDETPDRLKLTLQLDDAPLR